MQSASQCIQYKHASLSCSTMALNSWTSTSAVSKSRLSLIGQISTESTQSFDAIMLGDAAHQPTDRNY